MNNQEAIERLKEHISAITLYVTEAKLDEEEVENELLNIESLEMAIEALQFQDIMINNPKTAKPTPEVCKNCMDNKQDDWIPVSEGLPEPCVDVRVTCEVRYSERTQHTKKNLNFQTTIQKKKWNESCQNGQTNS